MKFKSILFACLSIFISCGLMAQPDAPTLQCTEVLGNGNVVLTWENNHTCGLAFTGTYIYSSDNINGPYTLVQVIANPNTATFEDATASASNNTLYYYLEAECGAGNFSVPSDTLDTIDALPPEIISVTVNGGSAFINWTEGSSPETAGYILFRYENGGPVIIDTIFDPLTTSFPDATGIPDLQAETYDIATIDACLNPGPFSNAPHTTIFLTANADSCDGNIHMFWSDYVGWDDIAYYIISDGFTPIDTVPSTQLDYVLPIDGGNSFLLTVKAEQLNGISSISNAVNIDLGAATLPSFLYIRNASVTSDNEIEIEWFVDSGLDVPNLLVQRGTELTNIESISNLAPVTLTVTMSYTDVVNTGRFDFYYNIVAADQCSQSIQSGNVRTILLEGQDNFNLSNGLSWNPFEIEFGTVQEYRLHRLNGDDYDEIAVLPATETKYIDLVEGVITASGFYCYRVEAIFDLDLPNGISETSSSFSNQICIGQSSRIYVPNAFVPQGVNNEFKPVIVYPNPSNYSMLILNRWGEKVFESTNPDIGWDGQVRGELAPQGVYAYVIKMGSFSGNEIVKNGTLTLIR